MMGITARHWREQPQRYRLEAGKCKVCGAIFFPPRLVCRECGSREFETIKLSGEGVIETFTIIRVPPTQFSDEAPYAVGIVKMAEGVKITTQIVDYPLDQIKTGQRVRFEFRRVQADGETGILCYGYKCVPV